MEFANIHTQYHKPTTIVERTSLAREKALAYLHLRLHRQTILLNLPSIALTNLMEIECTQPYLTLHAQQ